MYECLSNSCLDRQTDRLKYRQRDREIKIDRQTDCQRQIDRQPNKDRQINGKPVKTVKTPRYLRKTS